MGTVMQEPISFLRMEESLDSLEIAAAILLYNASLVTQFMPEHSISSKDASLRLLMLAYQALKKAPASITRVLVDFHIHNAMYRLEDM